MRVALMSDIHSNVRALAAVLRDVEQAAAGEVWVAGDTFGYYPWAADTFGLLGAAKPLAVLGNHDKWVVDAERAPHDLVGEIARANARDLAMHEPGALDWLASLSPVRRFERAGWAITIAHGTPDDPLEGRYYPDDARARDWIPRPGEIVVLGHTHHPLLRGTAREGLLLNPGSVGQPRDRSPMPSWALLDLATGTAELRRTSYDHRSTIAWLRDLGWNDRVTEALDRSARDASGATGGGPASGGLGC